MQQRKPASKLSFFPVSATWSVCIIFGFAGCAGFNGHQKQDNRGGGSGHNGFGPDGHIFRAPRHVATALYNIMKAPGSGSHVAEKTKPSNPAATDGLGLESGKIPPPHVTRRSSGDIPSRGVGSDAGSRKISSRVTCSDLSEVGKNIAITLAKKTAAAGIRRSVKVGIEKFLYEEREVTPFSFLIRKQVGMSLQSSGKFVEVVRDRFDTLQHETKFQQVSDLSSGEVARLKIDGAEAQIRGSFFVSNGIVTVSVSLVMIEGGQEFHSIESIRESDAGTRVTPR
jgi:hypothetical protein